MDEEIKIYLEDLSLLLNGQLRGAINTKAKEINLELIQITLGNTFKKAFELGQFIQEQNASADSLMEEIKKRLKDDTDRPEN